MTAQHELDGQSSLLIFNEVQKVMYRIPKGQIKRSLRDKKAWSIPTLNNVELPYKKVRFDDRFYTKDGTGDRMIKFSEIYKAILNKAQRNNISSIRLLCGIEGDHAFFTKDPEAFKEYFDSRTFSWVEVRDCFCLIITACIWGYVEQFMQMNDGPEQVFNYIQLPLRELSLSVAKSL